MGRRGDGGGVGEIIPRSKIFVCRVGVCGFGKEKSNCILQLRGQMAEFIDMFYVCGWFGVLTERIEMGV